MKIKVDDKEYHSDELSESAQDYIQFIRFVEERIKTLEGMRNLLQKAKLAYFDTLKKEMLSNKAGFLIEEE